MSLVEITIVIVILGVISAAIFLTLVSGTEHFNFARRQNELDTEGRLALDRITNEVIWAGYMPQGGWSNDEWHPIVLAEAGRLGFYADFEPFRELDPNDYRNITRVGNTILIADSSGITEEVGGNITNLTFQYLDEDGEVLSAPLSASDRDLVRHIRVGIELSQTWSGDLYQTNLHTTISPRNLGVNHNINPAFYPPAPLNGVVVVNIAGVATNPMPTLDESKLIDRLQYWGLTVTQLTDDMLESYDYTGTNLLILRHLSSGTHANPAFYQSLPVHIITLSAADAVSLFSMGTGAQEQICLTVTPFRDHPVNGLLPVGTPVQAYRVGTSGHQSILLGVDTLSAADPRLLTLVDDSTGWAGIAVLDESSEDMRRVHYSLWNTTAYSEEQGWPYLYRVIFWATDQEEEGDIGEPLGTLEDFEGPGVVTREVVLWQENVNSPSTVQDSIQLFYEPFLATPALTWTYRPLSGNGRIQVTGGYLQMDRTAVGAATRNIAAATVNLSPYNYLTDELALTVRCRSYEGSFDSRDGVFFGDADTLFFANFNAGTTLPAGITEQLGSSGRRTIHSPAGMGGDGNFITFDRSSSGAQASNRMAVAFGTGGHASGTPLTVGYRFHDHNDQNNTGSTGDFVGWNATGIAGTITNLQDLLPGSYDNNSWFNRLYSFTPATMPGTGYVIFGSSNNNAATYLYDYDGLSFDNIVVTADTTYTRIGAGTGAAAWETIRIDLDDAAQAAGYQFGSNYQISLSQYGSNPVTTGGIQYDDFRITRLQNRLTIPGWTQGPVIAGGIDSWNPKVILGIMGYSWTTQPASVDTYAPGTYCYLATPSVFVPALLANPTLQFTHSFGTEARDDGGFVQISTNGGTTWTTLTAASGLNYNSTSQSGFPAGTNIAIFSGTRGWQTETVSLAAYAGQTVKFRFVFGADADATVGSGWHLDGFRIFGTQQGYEVTALQFEASSVPLPWTYGVNVYMSSTASTSFPGAGELNKATMSHVVSAGTFTAGAAGWLTLTLGTPFILPPGQNLQIKMEQADATFSGMPVTWTSQNTGISNTCRQAASNVSDPVSLNIISRRPSIRLIAGGETLGEVTGTLASPLVPLNNGNLYNDFEAIYLATELGTVGTSSWTHGGTNDDWQIGTPFFLAVDPPLTGENGSNIAGNDLVINGYYGSDEWAWLMSPAYPMPDPALYDSMTVRYYRCLKLAALDAAYVYVGFSASTTPPTPSSSDWIRIRDYEGDNMISWDYEDVSAITEFQDAFAAGKTYYFLRFLLYSGPFAERGGWNLDNIQLYGK
jgi:hypothetical protein